MNLRPYQRDAIDATWSYLRARTDNLHCTNSDDDNDGFDTLANHSDKFEWCGPLVPANAEGERRP